MSIQFPTPASQGDTFTASNGVIYTYDNGGWTANSSLNSGQLAGFRNQLINGDFRIWQRGASQSAVGFGSADRWRSNSTRQINSSDSVIPTGFVRAIRGAVANEALSLRHPIELYSETSATNAGQFSTGSVWTLSWYVKCDDNTAGSTNVKLTWSDSSSNLGTAASSVTDVAFDGDWARYSTTFTIEGAPSNTDKCLILSMGVTPSATGKAVLTGVQLEPGPVATPFEHRPIGTELALCQRYFYKSDTNLRLYPPALTGGQRFLTVPRPVTMRAVPTETQSTSSLTLSGTAGVINVVGSQPDASSGLLLTGYTADAEL